MKRALASLVLFGATLAPELAFAKAVEDVRLDTDASDVIITVVADEALHAPSVRTSAGSVRVRFYDATDTKLVRLSGDGGAVRSLELGRGSDQSAALMLMLGDRTKLQIADVRVETDGDTTTLRIARGLLPAVREGVPSAPLPLAAGQKPALAPKPAALPAPVKSAQPVAAPAAPTSATTVTVRTEEVAPVAAPVAAPAPAAPALTLTKKPEPKELVLAKSESSPVPMLLAVSALLALAYAGLQFMLKKKKTLPGTDIPSIDVLAQRRIGPRHQLVVVRAFDRDYLLSIMGGTTTVIARSGRRKSEADALLGLAKRREDTRSFEHDDEPTFGGELFKQALEQRERAREQTASLRLEAVRAEAARAELLRESEPAPVETPASAVSDSVSGLLRLRKQAGR